MRSSWGARGVPGAGEKWRRAAGPASVEPLGATEVDGLRPYRPGTPASRIHWSALARGAGVLERRLQADTDSRPLVVVDARGSGPPAPPEYLDAAVRAAASLVLELGKQVGCGLLLPGEHRPLEVEPDLAALPVAHARLALVAGGPATPAPRPPQPARHPAAAGRDVRGRGLHRVRRRRGTPCPGARGGMSRPGGEDGA